MAKSTQTTNPFVQLFRALNAPWYGTLKQAAVQYIDTSEQWAQKALELNEQMTAWAKETPIASLFETQRSLARQTVESWTAFARSLWQAETKTEEKAA